MMTHTAPRAPYNHAMARPSPVRGVDVEMRSDMKRFRSWLVAVSIAACSVWAQAQDATSVADPAAEAQRILDDAARFQRGAKPMPAASSLYGRFYVQINDSQGKFSAEIERYYTREPERMLTSSVETVTGTRSSTGYDEGEAWFRNDKTGEVRVYSDRPDLYDVDLEKIDEQLRITRLMIDAIVIDALIPRLEDVTYNGEAAVTDLDGIDHPVQRVVATLPESPFSDATGEPIPAQLRLSIGKDGALRRLEVKADGHADMMLGFGFHGTTASGLRVPFNIKVWERGPSGPIERADLGVMEDEEGRALLEVDARFDRALFEAPRG